MASVFSCCDTKKATTLLLLFLSAVVRGVSKSLSFSQSLKVVSTTKKEIWLLLFCYSNAVQSEAFVVMIHKN